MKAKKVLALLVIISISFSLIGNIESPIAAAEENMDDILGEDLPEEISDDNLIIEEDEDYAGEKFDESDSDAQDDLEMEDVSEEELEDALDELKEKDIKVAYSITGKWDKHYNVDITLTNTSDTLIQNWEIEFPFPDTIENIWNAKITKDENGMYYIKNADWNQDIEAGKSVSFGMTVSCDDNSDINIPENCSVTKECVEVETEYDVTYKEYSKWDNKVSGEITIKNLSDRKIEDWKLELETNLVFTEIWNAEIKDTADYYCYLDNKGYNANISENGSVTFGFIAECNETPEISEYYLYEMTEPIDEEDEIIYELEEDEEERDEDDFDTKQEYQAYLTVRNYYAAKFSIGKDTSAKTKKTEYAKPVKWARKTTLTVDNVMYKITNLKHKLAIQAYTKVGNDLYITQRKGETIYITKCKLLEGKKRVYQPDGKSMKLAGFAHGQTLDAFEFKGETYLLLGANSRASFSRNLAFVKFIPNKKLVYSNPEDKEQFYRLTKLSYANQDRKFLGSTKRIDAALSANKKTLCVWDVVGQYVKEKNKETGEEVEKIKFQKIQIGCFKFEEILNHFEKHNNAKSLSFKSMKKKWCYYSCEQNTKSQFIRPGGSNQGIAVSNRYYTEEKSGDKTKKVYKNKIYFTAGNESAGTPLYIGMMILCKKGKLTKNGSYQTQMRLNIKKLKDANKECKYREIEGLHIEGKKLWFVVTPSGNNAKKKKLQYIYSIPKKYFEGNAKLPKKEK